MAGQVQSGVQHLPGLLAVVDQQPNVATNEVPLHGIHSSGRGKQQDAGIVHDSRRQNEEAGPSW
jgi:hypothetical protein